MAAESNKATSLIEIISNLPKNENNVPLRKAFNPMALPKLLPSYLLGEMIDFGSVIVRIAGEKLNEVYHTSLKGIDIFTILSSEEKTIVSNIHRCMFDHPCGVFTIRQLKKETGLYINLATYSFPMISNDGKKKYFLMYYEDLSSKNECESFQGKYANFSHYSAVEFLDIGNGAPNADSVIVELATLSLA
jgi:hypothetical protein